MEWGMSLVCYVASVLTANFFHISLSLIPCIVDGRFACLLLLSHAVQNLLLYLMTGAIVTLSHKLSRNSPNIGFQLLSEALNLMVEKNSELLHLLVMC